MITTAAAMAAGIPQQKLDFLYDYLGRRVEKKVFNNGSSTPTTHLKFVYSSTNWHLLAEYDGLNNNTVLRTYSWGLDLSRTTTGAGGVGGLLAIRDIATAVTYLPVYDANGNVFALVSKSTAALVASYEYSAFGETLRASGSSTFADKNPFRFSTKYTDAETQLVYYGYRYYNASLGRFVGRDAIHENGGINLYQFCKNNSVNLYDILGKYAPEWWNAMYAHQIGRGVASQYAGIGVPGAWKDSRSSVLENQSQDMALRQQWDLQKQDALIAGLNASLAPGATAAGNALSATTMAMINVNVASTWDSMGTSLSSGGSGATAASVSSQLVSFQSATETAVYGSATANAARNFAGAQEAEKSPDAPNNAGMNLQQAQALAGQLGWNGFTSNFSESQQLYYGKTAADILALQAQGKDVTALWKAVVGEVPGVITDSGGLMAGDSADRARSSWLSNNGAVVVGGAAVGAIITGYTRHGLNQAISRDGVGVSPSAMLDAVKYPQQTIPQAGGAVQYVGRDATVVVNANGKVITTWANNSGGVRVAPGNASNRPQGP